MPHYLLDDIRTKTSQLASSTSVSLHSILDSTPEPTVTASGIVPGKAPLDNPAPIVGVAPEPGEPTRRYSQRVRISTEKIAPHNETVAVLKAKCKNRKLSKKTSTNSLNSNQSTATNYVSDTDASQSSVIIHRISSTAVLPQPSATRVQEVPAPPVEGSRMVDGAASDSLTGGETERWDFSVDHERLELELSRLADADTEELSQISPRNLKAILQEVLEDRRSRLQAREVQPPKLKAQACSIHYLIGPYINS
ncbi:hypothetical protein FRC10_000823 [Ceratobasidium sp. 414]|nr:hypothetical protein FRC10_000823 [Ceratobasidium sp. 414]